MVADDPGAAAHVGALGVRVAGLVVLEVEGGVQEGKVGEQPLGRGLHGQLEQVVVGVAGVVVDPLLDLEDLDGEDAGLALAQARLGGFQKGGDDHPALPGGVCAVVDGGKGHLGPGPGVHQVQIVEEGFHGLAGLLPGLFFGLPGGEGLDLFHGILGAEGPEDVPLRLLVPGEVVHGQGLVQEIAGGDVGAGQELQGLGQVLPVGAGEALGHAGSHVIIEAGDALSAVLVVLVALDGDLGQGGVAGDGLGLPDGAVGVFKAACKELFQVDLAAGGGQGEEVHIVDVDVAVHVGPGVEGA